MAKKKFTTSNDMHKLRVFGGKRGNRRIGRVKSCVFHPSEKRCIGFIIKRPDLLWMFRRKDLFVSLHSNAAGSSARGFVAFTSAPPETAARNRLAAAIINRIHAAGVVLWGSGLAHEMYTVLASTTAPAVLLEYGFHTNAQDLALLKDAAYRDKLAQATCAGICDYLGLEVKEPDQESGQPNEPDSWAKEAWSKAVAAGIFDGTRPRDALTRQEAAVVLDRLNLL